MRGDRPSDPRVSGPEEQNLAALRGEARARLIRALASVIFDDERQARREATLRSLRP